jgi:hypothetical protein
MARGRARRCRFIARRPVGHRFTRLNGLSPRKLAGVADCLQSGGLRIGQRVILRLLYDAGLKGRVGGYDWCRSGQYEEKQKACTRKSAGDYGNAPSSGSP